MVTVVYAVYFKQYIVGGYTIDIFGLQRNPGDLFWGLGSALSMLIVGFTSPIMGATADFSNKKKPLLFLYSMVCILATIALFGLKNGMIWQGVFLFVTANVGFEGALVFYNGFLPQITTRQNIGKISGYGFAMGYVGSLISLLMAMPYANMALAANDLSLMRPAFVWAGLFFFVFSLPLYVFVKEKAISVKQNKRNSLKAGYRRIRHTLKRVREIPQITRFLTAYFIYIDGVNTVIYFSGIYASDSLGFSMAEVIQFFAIVQASAISGSYIFGFLTDKLGAKKTINVTLFLWMGVIVGGALSFSAFTFYFVGLAAGIAMGSSQAASRAFMGQLIPQGREAEFYGFYALTGKFSAVLGPLFFGITSTLTGSQRLAVLSVLLFFITGYLLLRRVDDGLSIK